MVTITLPLVLLVMLGFIWFLAGVTIGVILMSWLSQSPNRYQVTFHGLTTVVFVVIATYFFVTG